MSCSKNMDEPAAEKIARAKRYRKLAETISDQRLVENLMATADQLEREVDKANRSDETGDPKLGEEAS